MAVAISNSANGDCFASLAMTCAVISKAQFLITIRIITRLKITCYKKNQKFFSFLFLSQKPKKADFAIGKSRVFVFLQKSQADQIGQPGFHLCKRVPEVLLTKAYQLSYQLIYFRIAPSGCLLFASFGSFAFALTRCNLSATLAFPKSSSFSSTPYLSINS